MNTILRDLSIIWTLLHTFLMGMMLYESRYPKRKTYILNGAFMLGVIAITMRNVIVFGPHEAGQLLIFTCVLPNLFFMLFMAKKRDFRFFFTFCLVLTAVLDVLFATNLLDTALGLPNYIVMFCSRLLIFPLLEFLMVKYIRHPYHQMQQIMPKGWGIFLFMAVLFYLTLMLEAYHPYVILERTEYFPHLILLLVLVPAMYMTVFKFLWTQMHLFKTADENRALNMQIKMAHERLANGAETENRLQMLRHDMKHQMLLLNDYIRNGKSAEAEKYINTLLTDIDKNTLKTYCDNNSVNVVLSYYNKIADEKKIQFATSIQLPFKLKINETDLAVILSNGLENAINALANCEDKKIVIKSFIEQDKIYLEIKNPFNNSVMFDGKIPCSKKENHGFGTKSMAAIVEKYEGVYSFSVENGYFSFRCSI